MNINPIFNFIITLIIGLIAFYVVDWLGQEMGIPQTIILLVNLLIFLTLVFQLISLIKSANK